MSTPAPSAAAPEPAAARGRSAEPAAGGLPATMGDLTGPVAGADVTGAGASGGVLFVMPHHDDEVFCAACISHALRARRPVRILWATAGGLAPAGRRRREGEAVARLLGLGPADSLSLGLPDQGVLDHLDELGDAVGAMLPGVADVYVPAYEGGHPDHDAVNLVAARLCTPVARVYEFAEYRRLGPVIVVKAAFPEAAGTAGLLDSPALKLRRRLIVANGSQLPELFLFLAAGKLAGTWAKEPVRALPAHDYGRSPGGVRPLYETYTRRRFAEFRRAAEVWL